MGMWTLDDGLKLVRSIQPQVRKFGYHATLGGSVLNVGKSYKDLDIYFQPCAGVDNQGEELVKWLTSIWGEPSTLKKDYEPPQMDDGSYLSSSPARIRLKDPFVAKKTTLKDVYQWSLKFLRGQDRIDAFIVYSPNAHRNERAGLPGVAVDLETQPYADGGIIFSPATTAAADGGDSGRPQVTTRSNFRRWIEEYDAANRANRTAQTAVTQPPPTPATPVNDAAIASTQTMPAGDGSTITYHLNTAGTVINITRD